MDDVLELRLYRLHPGTRDRFHEIFVTGALPMLTRFGVDVVDHGPSVLDDTGYYLVRAFPSMESRAEMLARFYGSEEWLTTYDTEVMAMIDGYQTVVLPAGSPLSRAAGGARDT